jgi:hypothetical protein
LYIGDCQTEPPATHVCQRAMLYQERDLPCHVTNLTIFGTQCLFA